VDGGSVMLVVVVVTSVAASQAITTPRAPHARRARRIRAQRRLKRGGSPGRFVHSFVTTRHVRAQDLALGAAFPGARERSRSVRTRPTMRTLPIPANGGRVSSRDRLAR